jgi:lipoprotein-anchoring transpeptidase ErfK/SrfK
MRFSRRDFLKLGAATAAAGLAASHARVLASPLAQASGGSQLDSWKAKYKPGDWLGRVLGELSNAPPLHTRPDAQSPVVGKMAPDDIIPLLREVVGTGPKLDPHNHRWYETAQGYLWAPYVFPMEFRPNAPVEKIPDGKMWAEVTVPWVEGRAEPNESAPILSVAADTHSALLYYASVFPVTKLVKDEQGKVWYFLDELSLPMYARAEGLRMITAEEIAPISPDVGDKQIFVDLARQTLSAQENGVEVFYAVIASGPFIKKDNAWSTPPGDHPISWKRLGIRMSQGTRDFGYDEPGVGWATYFTSDGVAIHSTYWHNDFGLPKSHGCVNARPQDAKWIFRWTLPAVTLPEGEKRVQMPGGTHVHVSE